MQITMTTKQKKAIANIVENGVTPTQAMLEAGYSPASANNPSALTKSQAYQEAIEKGILQDDDIDVVLAPVRKALKAQTKTQVGEVTTDNGDGSKSTEYMYEYEDNIPLQLQGHDRAVKLLGLHKLHDEPDKPNSPGLNTEAIMDAIKAGDMVTLQQIIFNKGS